MKLKVHGGDVETSMSAIRRTRTASDREARVLPFSPEPRTTSTLPPAGPSTTAFAVRGTTVTRRDRAPVFLRRARKNQKSARRRRLRSGRKGNSSLWEGWVNTHGGTPAGNAARREPFLRMECSETERARREGGPPRTTVSALSKSVTHAEKAHANPEAPSILRSIRKRQRSPSSGTRGQLRGRRSE